MGVEELLDMPALGKGEGEIIDLLLLSLACGQETFVLPLGRAFAAALNVKLLGSGLAALDLIGAVGGSESGPAGGEPLGGKRGQEPLQRLGIAHGNQQVEGRFGLAA